MRVVVVLAGRERDGEAGHPAGEVAHAAEDPAHRGERPGRVEGQLGPSARRAPVAAGDPSGPGGLLRDLELLRLVAGARHAQRLEQPVRDVVRVGHARYGGDDPAQDRVAEVGVLEPGARRAVDAHAPGEELREVLQRKALLTVAPRVVGREARGHGQQLPDRDPGRIRAHWRPSGQLGNVVLGQVVQLQQAVVAQRQDRGRGEALGHRGDAEDRAGVRRRSAEVPLAEPSRVYQLAARHDPVRQPGLPSALVIARRQGIHMGEINHCPSLPEPLPVPLALVVMPSSNCPGTPLGRHETRRSTSMSQRTSAVMAATGPRTTPEPLYGGANTGRRVTVRDIAAAKARGEKWPMLTAYDALTAGIFDRAGIPVLLVGDSAAMVRGTSRALIVADLPFGSYQASAGAALAAATRFLKETGAHAVKLEGGERVARQVEELVAAGIPVMAHIGLTPQSVNAFGGYRVQGRGEDGERLLHDAKVLQAAGAYSVVLECVPEALAARVTEALTSPTIGIGAGPGCDAQVLVWQDMAGLSPRTAKFVKKYADLATVLSDAATAFADDVTGGTFPDEEHSYRGPTAV